MWTPCMKREIVSGCYLYKIYRYPKYKGASIKLNYEPSNSETKLQSNNALSTWLLQTKNGHNSNEMTKQNLYNRAHAADQNIAHTKNTSYS